MFHLKNLVITENEFSTYYKIYFQSLLLERKIIDDTDYLFTDTFKEFKNVDRFSIGSITFYPNTWTLI